MSVVVKISAKEDLKDVTHHNQYSEGRNRNDCILLRLGIIQSRSAISWYCGFVPVVQVDLKLDKIRHWL